MTYRRNVLIDDQPLLLPRHLAKRIGLNEAIILQQIHFLSNPDNRSGRTYQGHKWIYNTYDQWQEQFPFWSIPTIKRTILRLEKDGLIHTTDAINKMSMDRTKWYRINYDHPQLSPLDQSDTREDQSDPTGGSDRHAPTRELTTETSEDAIASSTTPKPKRNDYPQDFQDFWIGYPKGHGTKKLAYDEWKKLDGPERLAATDGLKKWKGSKRWADWYIRDAERFLKHRMWENPPAEMATPARSVPRATDEDPYLAQMLGTIE